MNAAAHENRTIANNPRTIELKNELDALKLELKRTRGSWKRRVLNDEIRSVAAELVRYMN